MPLPGYVTLHPVVELTDEQKQVLKNWTTSAKGDSIKKNKLISL